MLALFDVEISTLEVADDSVRAPVLQIEDRNIELQIDTLKLSHNGAVQLL